MKTARTIAGQKDLETATDQDAMTPRAYRALCKKLGLSPRQVAVRLGYSDRHGARWADDNDPNNVPLCVEIVLRLLLDAGTTNPRDLLKKKR